MNTTWLVAVREFTERLRSRAFLVSSVAVLALQLLALIVPNLCSAPAQGLLPRRQDGCLTPWLGSCDA